MLLEHEVWDEFLGWDLLDDYLNNIGDNEKEVVYPFFKYFTVDN